MMSTNIDRVRSIRNFAILVVLWGSAMLCLKVLVMGAGLPFAQRLTHPAVFASVTLIVTGVSTIAAVQAAIARSRTAHRILDFAIGVVALYGFVSLLLFSFIVGREQQLASAVAAITFATVFVAAVYAGLWRARGVGHQVIESLTQEDNLA